MGVLTWLALTVSACSDPAGPEGCGGAGAVDLGAGSCLVMEGAGLEAHRATVEREVRRAMTVVGGILPVDGVAIRVVAGSREAIPELGFGGRAMAGETVRLTLDPAFPGLAASLDAALFPLLAHELHHIARQRTVGYGSRLFQAMVSEGLADHFSVEVAGGGPPLWADALSRAEAEEWLNRSRPLWGSPYDHAAWFLGTSDDIPRWTGYTLGWVVVARYLEENPGRRPSDLHDEGSASFRAVMVPGH